MRQATACESQPRKTAEAMIATNFMALPIREFFASFVVEIGRDDGRQSHY
jgi:hypothetical protein